MKDNFDKEKKMSIVGEKHINLSNKLIKEILKKIQLGKLDRIEEQRQWMILFNINMEIYSMICSNHVRVIQELGEGINKFNKQIKYLTKLIEDKHDN